MAVGIAGLHLERDTDIFQGGLIARIDDDSASQYQATILWGDGTSNVGTVAGLRGSFTVAGQHTFLAQPFDSITVQVTDKDGTTASTTSSIQVGDVFAGTENILTVARFSSTLTSTLIATISWGDSTTSTVTVIGVNGNFTVQENHVYLQAGTYTIQVTGTDVSGCLTFSANCTITVVEAPVTVYQSNVPFTAGVPFGGFQVGVFTTLNPFQSGFQAETKWGDGTQSSDSVAGSQGLFRLLAAHSYPQRGTFPVQTPVQDAQQNNLGMLMAKAEPAKEKEAAPKKPIGREEMDVTDIFNSNSTDIGVKLISEIKDGKLIIMTNEGDGFKTVGQGFTFSEVVLGSIEGKGSNATLKDTDSVQVAFRWTNAKGEDVGHDTNALLADKPRKQGADWIVGGEEGKHTASWIKNVPDKATHLEVIILYTDCLGGSPASARQHDGDLPLIIGSFSAKLEKEGWTMKKNPDDVFKPRSFRDKPKKEDLAKLIDNEGKPEGTRQTLRKKTGYELRERPVGLSPTKTTAENKKIIDAALKDPKKINHVSDTGYDIKRRGGESPLTESK